MVEADLFRPWAARREERYEILRSDQCPAKVRRGSLSVRSNEIRWRSVAFLAFWRLKRLSGRMRGDDLLSLAMTRSFGER